MIYTYQKRKDLNGIAKQRYAGVQFEECRDGVPRMQCRSLPDGVVEVRDVAELGVYAAWCWVQHRVPLPVFCAIGWNARTCTADFYEVNYVTSGSDEHLREASKYIIQGRLFAEPFLG